MKKIIILLLIASFNLTGCKEKFAEAEEEVNPKEVISDNEDQKWADIETSVKERFNNRDYENDYLNLRLFDPHMTDQNVFQFYGQFSFYINSKNNYWEDEEFRNLYQHMGTSESNFDDDYDRLQKELYYFRIGTFGRNFAVVDHIRYNDLNRNISSYEDSNNPNAQMYYLQLIEFLKEFDITNKKNSEENEILNRFN